MGQEECLKFLRWDHGEALEQVLREIPYALSGNGPYDGFRRGGVLFWRTGVLRQEF